MCAAVAASTPWACRPWVSVVGSAEASPAIISEKNRPIDSADPALKNVPRMPDADPRCRAGTLFMMVAEFGAENSPDPTPLTGR